MSGLPVRIAEARKPAGRPGSAADSGEAGNRPLRTRAPPGCLAATEVAAIGQRFPRWEAAVGRCFSRRRAPVLGRSWRRCGRRRAQASPCPLLPDGRTVVRRGDDEFARHGFLKQHQLHFARGGIDRRRLALLRGRNRPAQPAHLARQGSLGGFGKTHRAGVPRKHPAPRHHLHHIPLHPRGEQPRGQHSDDSESARHARREISAFVSAQAEFSARV